MQDRHETHILSADVDAPQSQTEFDTSHLHVIGGREAIRMRPAMFIGHTDSHGLHSVFRHILENAIGGVLSGQASDIDVALHTDHSITVGDNGHGITMEIDEKTGLSILELAMTNFNANFLLKREGYRVESGLFDFVLVCANFLSEWCEVTVEQDENTYWLRYERGISCGPLKIIGPANRHGTSFTWLPDPEIFGEHKCQAGAITTLIQDMCYMNPEATVHFHNRLNQIELMTTYHNERGLADLVDSLSQGKERLGEVLHVRETSDGVFVDFALQFTETPDATIRTFANNIETDRGGTHLQGLQSGLRRAISSYARKSEDLNECAKYFRNQDITKGIVAAVSIRHQTPWFEGAIQARLGNPEVEGIIGLIVRNAVVEFFEEHPDIAQRIVERAADEQRKRRQPQFDESQLHLFDAHEHIRRRPAVYIGGLGQEGLHYLFTEVLNNAINQVLAGRATDINVGLNADGSISIRDNGEGIPEQIFGIQAISGIEAALTKIKLNAPRNNQFYHVGDGQRWNGLAAVSSLSAYCEAVVERNGQTYKLRCERGISATPLLDLGATTEHGTTLTWLPAPEIFGEHKYRPEIIKAHIKETCCLIPEATIHFHDRLNQEEPETYHNERGLADFVQACNTDQERVGDIIHAREIRDSVYVDFALQFISSASTTVITYANNVLTDWGGSHLRGFQSGIRQAVSSYGQKIGSLDGSARYFTYNDISQGLFAAVSIRLHNLDFVGASRRILGNSEVEGVVDVVVREAMSKFFTEYPEIGRQIVERAANQQRKRRDKIG